MSLFNLHDSTEQEIEVNRNKDDPSKEKDIGFFDNALSGVGTGFMSGSAKVAKTVSLAGSTIPVSVDALFGTDYQTSYFKNVVDGLANNAIDYWRPNEDVGTLGQVLHGATEIVSPLILGGPEGLAISHGTNTSAELLEEGVDLGTAELVGGIQGVGMLAGAKTPAAIGKSLPTKVITGSGMNAWQGLAMNKASEEALKKGGYNEQAQRFENSTESGAADVLMGAAFGGFAHMSKAEVDTHSNKKTRNSYYDDSKAVEPKDTGALADHVENLETAINALSKGERIDLSQLKAVQGEMRPLGFQTPVQPALFSHKTNALFNGNVSTSVIKTGAAGDIYSAARKTKVKGEEALLIASIETGGKFNADAKNPDSTAHGLFQVTDKTWGHLGGKDRNSKSEQIRIGLKNIEQTKDRLTKSLGREPKMHELYMGHMLGANGAKQVLTASRDTPLIDVVKKFGGRNSNKIVNNNGMKGLTVGQAISKWENKTNEHLSKIRSAKGVDGIGRAVEAGYVPFGYTHVNMGKYGSMSYVWGGKGKNNGIDCSGFVYQVMQDNGHQVPYMTTHQMYYNSSKHYDAVEAYAIKPGDVLVWRYKRKNGDEVGHTGIVESFDPATGKVKYVGSQRSNGKGKKTGPAYAEFNINNSEKVKFLRPKGANVDAQPSKRIFADAETPDLHATAKTDIQPVDAWADVDPAIYANANRFGYSNDFLTVAVQETIGVNLDSKPFTIDYNSLGEQIRTAEVETLITQKNVAWIPDVIYEPDSVSHVKLNDAVDEVTFYKNIDGEQYKAIARVDDNQLQVTRLEKQSSSFTPPKPEVKQAASTQKPTQTAPVKNMQPINQINSQPTGINKYGTAQGKPIETVSRIHEQSKPIEPSRAEPKPEQVKAVDGEAVASDHVEALREFIKENPDYSDVEIKTGVDVDGQERSGTLADILSDIDNERATDIRESESIVKAAICGLMRSA